MLKIVDYQPEHLERIELRLSHEGERPKAIPGPAITFLDGDLPIAIFGWAFLSPKVVQLWGLLSEEVRSRKILFHKTVREFLIYAFEKYGLQRMQFSVRVGFKVGWDWARSLGFQCEGIMRAYGPEATDYWLFARVRP